MRVVMISDTHLRHSKVIIPDGDLLIHSGDALYDGTRQEYKEFSQWFNDQPHKYKLYIPGNHDQFVEEHLELAREMSNFMILVNDTVVVNKYIIHGFPQTPLFGQWNFMLPRNGHELQTKIDMIPNDCDILISHGPAFGGLDRIKNGSSVGCELLAEKTKQMPNLKLHCFGHIHPSYGVTEYEFTRVNAAICNDWLYVVNEPIVIDLP